MVDERGDDEKRVWKLTVPAQLRREAVAHVRRTAFGVGHGRYDILLHLTVAVPVPIFIERAGVAGTVAGSYVRGQRIRGARRPSMACIEHDELRRGGLA